VLTARLIMRQLGSAVFILLCIVVFSTLSLLTLETVGWVAAIGVGCLSAPFLSAIVVRSPLARRIPTDQPSEGAALRSGAGPTRRSRLAFHAVLTGCLFLIAVLIVGTYVWLGTIASLVVMALLTVAAHLAARRVNRAL
jgi:hypothetical protein